MTLRTSSVRRQRQAWACLALVGVVAYFVLVRAFGLGNPLRFFGPHQMRVLLPLVVVLRILAREFRWDGIVREERVEGRGGDEVEKAGGGGQRKVASDSAGQPTGDGRARTPTAPQSSGNADSLGNDCGAPGGRPLPQRDESGASRSVFCQPQPFPLTSSQPPPSTSTSSSDGEALFAQARALPHQMIPNFQTDGPYLELLGKSAAAGYAPALAKLGEYAMRRAAWVEAYYWMSMAKRKGMQGLANVMREIRKNWSLDGFPDQLSNINMLFTLEAGSLGRALLHVDSGHDAAKAREFLKANHPDFLT